MTDNEIIKALECCCSAQVNACDDCPFYERCYNNNERLEKEAIDLINRQEAENERLQNILICFMDALGKVRKVDDIDEISLIPLMSELNKQYRSELKAEAYKEFAERLKAKSDSRFDYSELVFEISEEDIDNLVKEMVGEG